MDTQHTATELGRDRDMSRNVPMGAMLAPQPKAREKTFGRRRIGIHKKGAYLQRHVILVLLLSQCCIHIVYVGSA